MTISRRPRRTPRCQTQVWPGSAYLPTYVPTCLPAPIVERLNREVNFAFKDLQLQSAMKAQFLTPLPGTRAAILELVRKDIPNWIAGAKAASVEPE